MANSVVGFLLLAWVLSIIVGCKVAVMVVEGGEVQSSDSGIQPWAVRSSRIVSSWFLVVPLIQGVVSKN